MPLIIPAGQALCCVTGAMGNRRDVALPSVSSQVIEKDTYMVKIPCDKKDSYTVKIPCDNKDTQLKYHVIRDAVS